MNQLHRYNSAERGHSTQVAISELGHLCDDFDLDVKRGRTFSGFATNRSFFFPHTPFVHAPMVTHPPLVKNDSESMKIIFILNNHRQ